MIHKFLLDSEKVVDTDGNDSDPDSFTLLTANLPDCIHLFLYHL